MKLVIGLGNPEPKYSKTRHNTGFMVVDVLQELKPPRQVVVKRSAAFMNESGKYVRNLVEKYAISPDGLYVVHDDLDLPLGSFKIQLGKGPKDHNGLKSIDNALGTNRYWHVRMGIENRDPNNRIDGYDYVLEDFSKSEKEIVDKTIEDLCKKLVTLLKNTK